MKTVLRLAQDLRPGDCIQHGQAKTAVVQSVEPIEQTIRRRKIEVRVQYPDGATRTLRYSEQQTVVVLV